jgi:hypothetical protein
LDTPESAALNLESSEPAEKQPVECLWITSAEKISNPNVRSLE